MPLLLLLLLLLRVCLVWVGCHLVLGECMRVVE